MSETSLAQSSYEGERIMAETELARELIRTNEEIAAENKRLMEENGVILVNLIGETGTGKTTILEKIVPLLKTRLNISVIEGNIATDHTEKRIIAPGVEAIRIDTRGALCLDAAMVNEALRRLPLANVDLIIVDNDSNLSCPAEVDLGGDLKIVVSGVTEGMDMPAKHPVAFRKATVALISKIDLLPYGEFNLLAYIEQLVALNSGLKIFPLSALAGEGIEELSNFIGRMIWKKRRNLAA
jgi:hydrogenase nickel incorporation protein HypB